MKKIKLTQNKFAIVDNEDFDMLNKHKWYANKNGNTFYAVRCSKKDEGKKMKIYMHRVIAKTLNNIETDHIDRDGLNNQRKNLRACSRSENLINRNILKSNTSGYRGVSWDKLYKKWRAVISIDKKYIKLGNFIKKEEACNAYKEASFKYHKNFSVR